MEDMDIRKSMQKNNAKMINIYLKTPYKVLTINQIKTKEKVDRERDLEINMNVSPTRLFRAENNLDIATNYRQKKQFQPVGGKFKHKGDNSQAAMVNTSLFSDIEPDQGSTFKEKGVLSGRKGANFTNTRQSLMKDQSMSNMSETKISGLGHSINIRDVDGPGQ